MKIFICWFFAMFFFAISINARADCEFEEGWLWNYEGDIGGKYPIRMTLARENNSIKGVYFYIAHLKDIKIAGIMTSPSNVLLKEFNETGEVTAEFHGTFANVDPKNYNSNKLQCEVFVGTWKNTNTNAQLPFYLRMTDGVSGFLFNRYAVAGANNDELIHKKAFAFWSAVKVDNMEEVAKYIKYPFTISFNNEDLEINTQEEFIKKYDQIIPKLTKEKIAKAIPRNMFAKHHGIMLGNGVVWFGPDGKVYTINQ